MTNSSGDVAAVGVEISPSAIDFTIPRLMLMSVMVECGDNFRSRVKKCQTALEDYGGIRIASLGSLNAGRLSERTGQDDSQVLQSVCNELRSFNASIVVLRSQPARLISQKAQIPPTDPKIRSILHRRNPNQVVIGTPPRVPQACLQYRYPRSTISPIQWCFLSSKRGL